MEGEEVWRKKNLLTFEQTGSTGGGTGTGMERCRSKDEVTLQEQEKRPGGRKDSRTYSCLLPPPPDKAARSAFRWPKKGSMDGAGKGTADGTKVKKMKRMKQMEKGGE